MLLKWVRRFDLGTSMDIRVIPASKDLIVNSYVLIIYALAVELVMSTLEYI